MSGPVVTYAEAQQRAEEWINNGVPSYQRREVRVREFDLGFVAWAVDRADGPSSDGGAVRLVIARDSGVTTLWPALPINDVVRRYEEAYGRPMGATPTGTPAAQGRNMVEATSFLLSPPQWLQEAGAAAIEAEAGAVQGAAQAAQPAPPPAPRSAPPSHMVAPPVSEGPPGDVPTMLSPPPDWAGARPPAQAAPQQGYVPTVRAPQGPPPSQGGPGYGNEPTVRAPQGPPSQGGPGYGNEPTVRAPQGPPPQYAPPQGQSSASLDYAPTMLSRPSGPPTPPPAVPTGGPPPPPPSGLLGGPAAPQSSPSQGGGPAAPAPPGPPPAPPGLPQGFLQGGPGMPPPPPPGLVGPGGSAPQGSPSTPAPGVPGLPPPPPPGGLRGATPSGGVPLPAPDAGDSYVPTQFAPALNLPRGPAAPVTPAPPQAAAQPGVPTVGPGYMAVLRYRGPDGAEQQLIQRSTLGLPHPEWQILQEVRRLNVPPEQVLELHTELESCDLPGGYCQRMVKEAWPNVRVSSIAPYGLDQAARQRGVQHLFEHHGELHTHAAGPAPQRPFRVPLPPPGSVQPAPPVPPQVLADELAQAFGPQNVFRYEAQAVSRQGIPEAVSGTLTWAGLPVEFGPFFWAQAQQGRPMPTLAELAAERGIVAQPDAGTYLVLGNDYGRQLCVQYGTAAIVAVDLGTPTQPAGPEAQQPRFVNSGLPEFVRCMALLGRMWRFRYGLTPEQAGHWTTDFQAQLAALDPAALQSGETWWAVLLEQLWDGLL